MSRCCAADCTLPATSANSRSWERTVPQSVGRTMRRRLGMLQSISSLRRTKLRWACSTSSRGVEASTNSVISCNSGQIWISEVDETWHSHKKQECQSRLCMECGETPVALFMTFLWPILELVGCTCLRYRRVRSCHTGPNASCSLRFLCLQDWNWVLGGLFEDLTVGRDNG